jgi:hypothetical protein
MEEFNERRAAVRPMPNRKGNTETIFRYGSCSEQGNPIPIDLAFPFKEKSSVRSIMAFLVQIEIMLKVI